MDQANSAAAVAQAALKNMQKKQVLINHLTSTMKQQPESSSTNKLTGNIP
jgi:hypothetical protein